MKIFLIILAAILSYVVCIGIAIKGAFDVMMIFPKKGYIINQDKLEEEKTKINNVYVSTKSRFLLLVPFVNMIYTSWLMHNSANKVFDECKKQHSLLVPMTKEEIKEFKSRKGYMQKLDYFMKLMVQIKKEPIIEAKSYEVINDSSDTQEEVKENQILDEYRKLRNEFNSLDSCEDYFEEHDDYSLSRKI